MLLKPPDSLHVQWVDQCVRDNCACSTSNGIAPRRERLDLRLSSHVEFRSDGRLAGSVVSGAGTVDGGRGAVLGGFRSLLHHNPLEQADLQSGFLNSW